MLNISTIMDINPIQSAMEFLDLSDANDDEKAEAMAIIGSAPLQGVQFPFEFKPSECMDLCSKTHSMSSGVTQSGAESSVHSNQPPRQKSSPPQDFNASHSSEAVPQTTNNMSQWEMNAPAMGPVVCGPPQYIYHQTGPHYFPTSAPMPGPFYNPVSNGTPITMSPKDVKMHATSSHIKSGKSVLSQDIRSPFYAPHTQYADVSQPQPTTMVSDGQMILTNGPPVQPIFSPVQPGFPHTFMSPHSPFPQPQMYIIATPEGSYLTYALPPGVPPMTRQNDPTSPPSVPNVNEDISAINTNVPSNDGHISNPDNDAPEDIQPINDNAIEADTDDQNMNNECGDQDYKSNEELNEQTKEEDFNTKDNSSKPVTDQELTDSSDITANSSTQANSVYPSTSPTPIANTSGGQKSWADLFKKNSSLNHSLNTTNNSSTALSSGVIVSQNFINNLSESDTPLNSIDVNYENDKTAQIQSIPMRNDPFARKLAKRIKDMNLKHFLPFLIPYGLINRGNWCYINATLQALVGCPPFYNLMREIGETSGLFRERSSTPIIDSFARFFAQFNPSEHFARKQRAGANVSVEDLPKGEPIEPRCIYDVLGSIKSECLKGRQEDAEEFLSSVLNGLHEEMVALFKLLSNETESVNGDHPKANGHIDGEENGNNLSIEDDSVNDDDDANLWKEVSSRHKAMPTRSAKVISTPIVEMFGGSTLSVRTAGKDVCANRQPFFTLQLDIQSDRVKSVEDALKCLTSSESIQGYMCPKTKQAMDASAQTFLDTLPSILILHLKLFVYDIDGGCRKLMKRIEYPVDLDLPRECLHLDKLEKQNSQLKRYKLLSVVYHDGAEAIKGHYVTDVYHIGSNQWLRCDDGSVKVIPIQKVLNTETSRTPYLLFYRRFDTLYGKHLNPSSNSKTYSH